MKKNNLFILLNMLMILGFSSCNVDNPNISSDENVSTNSESLSTSSTPSESETVKDVLDKKKIEEIFLTMNDLTEISVSGINYKDVFTVEFYVENNLISITEKTKTRYYIKENDVTYLIEKVNDDWIKSQSEEVDFSLKYCFDFSTLTIGDDLVIEDNKATFSDVNYGNVQIIFINNLVYSVKTTDGNNKTILNYIFTTGKKNITLPEVKE